MPLFNEKGEEVENALTAEEVEAKLAETKEAAEIEASEQLDKYQKETEEEVTKLNEQITAKEAELEKEKDKDKNFSKIRGSNKEKDEKINKLTEEIAGLKTEVTEKFKGIEKKDEDETAKVIDIKIDKMAKGDKELAEKIKYHYNALTGEKDVQKRLESAEVLATGGNGGGEGGSLPGNVISSAGNPGLDINPSGEKLGAGAKEVAGKLGITDQELAKHKLL